MKRLHPVSLACILVSSALAQPPGGIPPAISWTNLKGNCPPSLDWSNLRGRTVILSFGLDDMFLPEDIAEWNELPETFPDAPVVFLKVFSGSNFLLEQGLHLTPYRGCLLVDREQSNRERFKLPMLPLTVVIAPSGFIAGYSAGDLDETSLRSVLRDPADADLLSLPPHPTARSRTAAPDSPASYEVHISAAAPDEPRALGDGGPDRYTSRNQPLPLLLLSLWNVSLARISYPPDQDRGNYDVSAHTPVANPEVLLKTVQQALQQRLHLSIDFETRTERVFVMTASGATAPGLQPAAEADTGMIGVGGNSIVGTAQTMYQVASALEGLLHVPVIDETGRIGNFNFAAYSKASPSEAPFDLARQLGVQLTAADRPVDMLVVRHLN